MKNMLRTSIRRTIACSVAASLMLQTLVPTIAFALTGGPNQPEFSTFESVTTANMVDPLTGQFSYNLPVVSIPGPNGSGYSLSLSYHSGSTNEDEASWVGKGWTLNPGSIARNTRVYPDDYKNADVAFINRTEDNTSISVTTDAGAELFSQELKESFGSGIDAGAGATTSYNNRTGWHHLLTFGLSAQGFADLDFNIKDGEATFKPTMSPARLLGKMADEGLKGLVGASDKDWPAQGVVRSISLGRNPNFLSAFLGGNSYPVNITEYELQSGVHVKGSVNGDVVGLAGARAGIDGVYLNHRTTDKLRHAFGFMYSGYTDEGSEMDYSVERGADYNTRDYYLGIPTSGADAYMVFGEGVSGSFRMYHAGTGQFHPGGRYTDYITSQEGIQIHLGGTSGIGTQVIGDHHEFKASPWTSNEAEDQGSDGFEFKTFENSDEPVFFRYFGDPGGSVEYAPGDGARQTNLSEPLIVNPFKQYHYSIQNNGIWKTVNNGKRPGRSTYVGFHTNAEMAEQPSILCYNAPGPSFYRAYNKADSSRRFVDRADPKIKDGIGEFGIVRPNGMRYVYGLPVYARNEHSLSFQVKGGATADGILTYQSCSVDDPDQRVTGTIKAWPYASSYLLTEITTPDYVDRANDGPSADDLGGYTKFNYKRTAGADTKSGAMSEAWYKWRIPYRGLHFDRNSFSDPADDQGTVQYGEKEVYYLSSIETKTHIARFHTSSRLDGFEAERNELNASGTESYTPPANAVNKLHKLDSISLYVKNPDGSIGRLVQKVHLRYSYTLWPNTLNALAAQGGGRHGSLTLERVWFEYEGAVNARTTPYIFGYTYRRSADYDASLASKYGAITGFANHFTAAAETPQYTTTGVDAWGYYRHNGINRSSKLEPWLDQNPSFNDFDPAAWQLKWIKLPSGGEIQVQYEQNEYTHVHDQRAMAMVRLADENGNPTADGSVQNIDLRLDELGVQPSELPALASYLKKRFITDKEPMYYKFLYALRGETANLTNCASEYTVGYLYPEAITLEGGTHIRIRLRPAQTQSFLADLFQQTFEHPRDMVHRFYATNRADIVDPTGICDPDVRGLRLVGKGVEQVLLEEVLARFVHQFFASDKVGRRVNLQQSFLRIPLLRAKKGGGIRVKRLLTYDRGIESGAAALYGTEYSYTNEDGTPGGVATNEPGTCREENPLVSYIKKRDGQDGLTNVVAGVDLEQFDGPLGESLLPGPSVAYRRVVGRNIHTGRTGTGYAVYEYNTVYDFPFNKNYSVFGGGAYPWSVATGVDPLDQVFDFGATILSSRFDNTYRTQGYTFVLNEMHGRPKRSASYGGDPGTPGVPLEETRYEYYKPGEQVPLKSGLEQASTLGYPGKVMEIVMENRKVASRTQALGGKADFGVTTGFVWPWLSGGAALNYQEQILFLHVTTKVVRYPAIVKSVTTMSDGLEKNAENVAFDRETGQPVITRTADDYHNLTLGSSTATHTGWYYTYGIPAYWQYPDLGPVGTRERLALSTMVSGKLTTEKWYSMEGSASSRHYLNFKFLDPTLMTSTIGMLTPGDLIRLEGNVNPSDNTPTGYLGTYHVGRVIGNQVELIPTYISNENTTVRTSVARIVIIRAARTNQLELNVGSITTYGTTELNTTNVPLQ